MSTTMQRGTGESADLPLDALIAALESLGDSLRETDDFSLLLAKTCDWALSAVPRASCASLILSPGLVYRTGGASDEVGAAVELHAHSGVVAAQGTVRCTIDDASILSPEFAEKAAAAGIRGVLSVPFVVDDEYHGAVNCYSVAMDGFTAGDGQLLELFAVAAEALLRSHRRYYEAHLLSQQLRNALDSRGVIEQAKGVIMAVRKINADDAFAALVAQSQRENIKTRELAERLINNILSGEG